MPMAMSALDWIAVHRERLPEISAAFKFALRELFWTHRLLANNKVTYS